MTTKTKRHPALSHHIWKAAFEPAAQVWHIEATTFTDGEKRAHTIHQDVPGGPRKGLQRITDRLVDRCRDEFSAILYAEDAAKAAPNAQ